MSRKMMSKLKGYRHVGPFKIDISAEMYQQFTRRLRENKTDEGTFLGLAIRQYMRSSQGTLELTDRIPFGKFEGARLEDAIRVNPDYILWMVQNTNKVKLSEEASRLLCELIPGLELKKIDSETGEEIPF